MDERKIKQNRMLRGEKLIFWTDYYFEIISPSIANLMIESPIFEYLFS